MITNPKGKHSLLISDISTNHLSAEQEAVKRLVMERLKNKHESLSAHDDLIAYDNMKHAEGASKNASSNTKRKVLIDQSFCRYILKRNINKKAICDILLSKNVKVYITSCNTGALKIGKVLSEDKLEALITWALSLTELRCDHSHSSMTSSDCLEMLVQNGNPNRYFVATKDDNFVKKLLKLPGVAVITGNRGKLILQGPSASKNYFGEKVGEVKGKEDVLEQIKAVSVATSEKLKKHMSKAKESESKTGVTENSTRKRKTLNGSDREKSVTDSRRVEQKLQKKTELEGKEDVLEQIKAVSVAASEKLKKHMSKEAKESESKTGVTENSTRKRKNLDESERKESGTDNRRVKQKLQKKTVVEKELVTVDEHLRCRSLFMGNLNFSVKEDDVESFFGSIGVEEVRLSKRKKKSAHFGHVEFISAEAARQAIKLNGQKLLGRPIRLSYAEKRPKLDEMLAGKVVAGRSGVVSKSYVGNGSCGGIGGRHGGHGRGGGYGFRGQGSGFTSGRGRHGGYGAGRGRRVGK